MREAREEESQQEQRQEPERKAVQGEQEDGKGKVGSILAPSKDKEPLTSERINISTMEQLKETILM